MHQQTMWATNKSVDDYASNVTSSTRKNTQDNNMAIKDFFKPQ